MLMMEHWDLQRAMTRPEDRDLWGATDPIPLAQHIASCGHCRVTYTGLRSVWELSPARWLLMRRIPALYPDSPGL